VFYFSFIEILSFRVHVKLCYRIVSYFRMFKWLYRPSWLGVFWQSTLEMAKNTQQRATKYVIRIVRRTLTHHQLVRRQRREHPTQSSLTVRNATSSHCINST